jgi:aspartyl-tRNA(Asn)/glutamyl-tRNA(Gln) amidotransferase subunit B
VEKAIEFEILRQKMAIDQGEKIVQETRHYDADSGDSISLREKETEEDYGYMFDPDLPKMVCDEKKIALIKKNMPELPQQRAERMMKQYQLSEYNAGIIASEKKMADFFEDVATKIDVDTTVKWMTGPLKKVLNYNGLSLSETDITSGHFITFLTMIKKGELTPRLGDLLLREFVLHPQDPKKLAEKMKFSVESNLEATVDAVVKKETKAVQDYQQGQQKAFDYLLGQIMRATGQKADMKEATKLLKKKLTR